MIRWGRWAVVAVYAGFIFWASHQPQWIVRLPHFVLADKVAHLTEFAILAALVVWALGLDAASPKRLMVATALVIAYGVLDEIHQAFVPGRVSDPADALADALGALLVLALHFAWRKVRVRTADEERG